MSIRGNGQLSTRAIENYGRRSDRPNEEWADSQYRYSDDENRCTRNVKNIGE
jgi:hypothetical protein